MFEAPWRSSVVVALALTVVILPGCGGPRTKAGAPPPVAAGYVATRWIPAHPTYVLAAPTVHDAQRAMHDAIDVLALLVGPELEGEVSRELSQLLSVDPLSPEALAGMGIDLEGGFAVFSDAIAPTLVAHLNAPDLTRAFFDRLRDRGLITQSVVVDNTEVFTAQLIADLKVSWAIADGWLWVHFTPPIARHEGSDWFTASHRPAGQGWAASWQWARDAIGAATPGMLGFVDARAMIGGLVARLPDAAACATLLAPVRRIALSIDGDGTTAGGRIVVDVGDAAAAVTGALLPAPEGFAAAAAGAPLSAQWNLDLVAIRGWAHPCLQAVGEDLKWLDKLGVRAGRGVLQQLDPDDKSGAGAISLDLAHDKFFASKLDDIPMRSALERNRTFGPHAGHSISIPFVATIEYVLNPRVALVAVGDGLLARIVGAGGTQPGPIAAVDVVPAGLSAEAWRTLFDAIDLPPQIADRLLRWKDGHVRIEVDGTAIVLTARGSRR